MQPEFVHWLWCNTLAYYSADMLRMQSAQTFAIDGNVDPPANLFTTRLEMKDSFLVNIHSYFNPLEY